MVQKAYKTITSILIAGLFLSFPVTNFPYFPASFGGNVAALRPLLIYPLFALVFLVTIPRLISKPIPRAVLIMFLFFIWGVIVSIIPIIQGVESPWREVSLIPRELRTIITLGLGVVLYFTISQYPLSVKDLRFYLRWLYIGLGMVLTWSSLQAIYILDLIPGWYEVMYKLQSFIALRPLNATRLSGMTYEPSFFADQIIVIWLPWVMTASLDDYTVFKWRWKWVSVERILFIWTMVILVFTLSRAGLFVGLGVICFALVFKYFTSKRTRHKEDKEIKGSPVVLKNWIFRSALVLLGIGAFLGVFYLLGRQSDYISRMWQYSPFSENFNFGSYFDYIGFGARISYWETAWQIFLHNPLLGVGLGNFTLYFVDYLPYQQLSVIPELLRHIVPAVDRTRVISVKHFLVRILAEMGIVGFGIFVVFVIVIAAMALYLWSSKDNEEKFWGTAGIIGLVALLGDTFSFDSFAIPNPWIFFGLITAAVNVYMAKTNNRRNTSR